MKDKTKPQVDWVKVINIVIRILTIGLVHLEKRKQKEQAE